jgi:diacylglycerol kinase
MKNKNFFQSVYCAFRGLFQALKRERNFKVYGIHIAVTLVLNILCHFSLTQYLIWGVTIIGVFSTECMNTALERLCDFITLEHHDAIRYIKDVSAAALLCWGVIFYTAEMVMIGVNLFAG